MWLFGPTASGKSALALSIAMRRDAVIINADASQLYADISILTARPRPEELGQTCHALYGCLPGDQPASAGIWLGLVEPAIRATLDAGRLPILVGGTGMYIQSLLEGIAPIPRVPSQIRSAVQDEHRLHGLPRLRAELLVEDPELANRLTQGDTQRILRGVEVWRATGKPLSHWQSLPRLHILPELRWHGLCLLPEREVLYANIDQRAERMMQEGAVQEVKALLAKRYPEDAPILKAIGVPEIREWLEGSSSEVNALRLLQQRSRNYAKRQMTWAKGRFGTSSS